jgi:hypothetical protein
MVRVEVIILIAYIVLSVVFYGLFTYLSYRDYIQLNKYLTSYEPFQASRKTSVDYFSMEGCPYCKQFDPIWNSVVEKVEGSPSASSIEMHKWDVRTPEGKAKAEAENVSAFPHVQKSSGGEEPAVFEGKRTEGELLKFVKE